jgi:hypothetical protein
VPAFALSHPTLPPPRGESLGFRVLGLGLKNQMTTVGWSFDLKINKKKKDNLWFGLLENLEVQRNLLSLLCFVFRV